MTEVRSRAGQPASGYEASCKHPAAHASNQCRRTLKFDKHGGPERTLKKLKWWLLQACHYSDKDEHVRLCPYCWEGPEPTDETLNGSISALQPMASCLQHSLHQFQMLIVVAASSRPSASDPMPKQKRALPSDFPYSAAVKKLDARMVLCL